jgi:hypothetical protein
VINEGVRKAVVAIAGVIATLVIGTSGAGGAPSTLHLTFNGAHADDPSLPAGIRHEGPFTSSPPLCSSGTARDVKDVSVEPLTVLREFTCDDGSGTFTAFLPGIASEHGGSGTWRIVNGTNRYVTLRGQGRYESVLTGGNPQDFLAVKYRATWTGVIDFDTAAPVIRISVKTLKLAKPPGTYTLRATIGLGGEASGARVSYILEVTGGQRDLLTRLGTSTTAGFAVRARIKPTAATRRIRIRVTASDAVGNERTSTALVRLAGR